MIMSIKRYLRQKLDYVKTRLSIAKLYYADCKYNIKYHRGTCEDSKDKSDANIMLVMHALEKGMSFSRSAGSREFGGAKAISLVNYLLEHEKKYEIDAQFVTAVNILAAYLQDRNSTKDKNQRDKISKFIECHHDLITPNKGGVKKVSKPTNSLTFDDVKSFYVSRSSVREYSAEPITDSEINKAKEIASLSPSACNRQASRVYSIKDRNIIKILIDNQLGDQGWCNNAETLFVITNKASYFGNIYERNEPYIDGGMFAMNFMMGLHAQGIASCYKMYIREPSKDAEFRNIAGISNNEIPIILILAGHYLAKPVTSPFSFRNEL